MQLIELLRYDFMRYALISGLLLGATCALLGVFVNLRGMAQSQKGEGMTAQ